MVRLARTELVRTLIVALLAICTAAFFNLYERYEPVGGELLADPHFGEGFARWKQSGRGIAEIIDDQVILRARERAADVAVRQTIQDPGRFGHVRLSGELKATDIRPGTRSWQRGYLALVSFDGNRNMLRVPHVVADVDGTQPWRSYREVFRVPEEAQELQVSVQIIGATGTLAVRNLSLVEVAERSSYSVLRGSWLIVWIAVLAWLVAPYLSRVRFDLPHVLAYLIVAGILTGTLMPVSFKVAAESWLGDVFLQTAQLLGSELPPQSGPLSLQHFPAYEPVLTKLGHLLLFGLLGVVVRWAYPRPPRSSVVLGLVTLACVSEVLQFFVDGRSARITDLLIDAAGVTLGVLAYDGARQAMQESGKR